MNALGIPESLGIVLGAVAAAFTAGRLFFLGAARHQRALLTFLIFSAVSQLALSFASIKSPLYFWIFLFYEVAGWGIYVWAVHEMFALAMDRYPGIRTVGRWVMYAAVGLSTLASVILAAFFWRGGARGRSHLFYFLVVDRSVQFSLAVIIVAIVVFLSRYPLHLHRNIYISSLFFSAGFLAQALNLLIGSVSPDLYSHYANQAQVIFGNLCFLGWGVMLRRESQEARRVSFTNPEEHQLLQQLENLNRLLSRAGRQ